MSKKILKRSLALGALMAFVITGQAWAGWAFWSAGGKTTIIEGNNQVTLNGIADNPPNSDDYVFGGLYAQHSDSINNIPVKLNSDLMLKGDGSFVTVAGGSGPNLGHQSDKSYLTESAKIEHGDLKTTIEYATVKHYTVGGSKIFRNSANGDRNYSHQNLDQDKKFKSDCGIFNITTTSTTLNIKDGNYGTGDAVCSYDAPFTLVAGGDLVKDIGWGMVKTVSTIRNTNLDISGGNFNSIVLGGSAGVNYADYHTCIDLNVDKATTDITGGTFSKPVYAGGAVYTSSDHYNCCEVQYVKSYVKDAELNISNVEIKDVYAGGLIMYEEVESLGEATVDKSTVNINKATIGNIYGLTGYATHNTAKDDFVYTATLESVKNIVDTDLTLTNATANTVDIPEGSITLVATGNGSTKIQELKFGSGVGITFTTDGETTDVLDGNPQELMKKITVVNVGEENDKANLSNAKGIMPKGSVVGEVTFETDAYGNVISSSIKEAPHEGNAGVTHNANIALMAWRAETNDMNKRMGELRNANGEHGVWARMVGGEDEFKNAEYEYTQYQLGYDEKLSVDPSWTVGVALSYTDGESNFGKGSGENTHKGLSVYGSKLNDDGSFIDLIAKYSRLEHDFTVEGDKGDYSTNGYSVSAEYGKRFKQGNGLWIEPQVELTYGKVKSAEYKLGQKTVSQDAMESLVGRVGFSLGKDISKGNVYARASYLYDFEGETNMAFTNGATRNFAYDLGGGWWEVGVGANINLSKATYIYADVEKTFGGEVDTNWQWNLGVRYSF